MRLIKLFILLSFLLIGIGSTYAFDGLAVYTAKISYSDRFNSYGDRLYSVRAILRQDRANYCHRKKMHHAGPADADFFCSKYHRKIFNHANIYFSPRTASHIVYGKYGKAVFICVVVLSPKKISVSSGDCPRV